MARPTTPAPKNQTQVGQAAGRGLRTGLHHHVGRDQQADDRQQGGDPVAPVEHVHRVFVLAPADEEDGHDRGQQAEGPDDEREEDPRLGVGPAGRLGDRVDRDAQDHRPDVLGGGRLEQVGAAAGAVADVVTDQVGDHARVARVILGDALLDLADQVRPDVGGLRVDPAAELGEEGHERGAEAVADDQEGRLLGVVEATEGDEHDVDAQQRQGDHEEARDRPAAHRDLDRLDQAAPGGSGRPDVRLDADEHADDPGGHRAGGADQERDPGPPAEVEAVELGVGDLLGDEGGDHPGDDHRADEGEDPDRRVLPPDERDRALEDGPGDLLHLLGAGVPAKDVTGQVQREQDGDQARRQDDQLES